MPQSWKELMVYIQFKLSVSQIVLNPAEAPLDYLWLAKMFLSKQNNHSCNSLCIGQDGKMPHTECSQHHRMQYFTSFVLADYLQLQEVCAQRAYIKYTEQT